MRLGDILFTQGFGSRRECAALVHSGSVAVEGQTLGDPDQPFNTEGLTFSVNGLPWPFHARVLILLNKPAGFECSRDPQHHDSVMSLLPAPLQRRGVQPVGRLDQDTTGALLLTDHGPWLHRLTHPKRHVEKLYRVTTARDIEGAQVSSLLRGVTLHGDTKPAVALRCEVQGPRELLLGISEGRYHQVKRMLAAVGNHVEALHRQSFGVWQLPLELAPGHWQYLKAPPELG